MSENVYKIIELTGTSSESVEKAIRNAVSHASKTVRHLSWFQVCETRGSVKDGVVEEFQVVLKAGFRLDS